MSADPAVSMAMLKVNADRLGQDILSHFEPFVLDRLYHSEANVVSIPELHEAVLSEYGISLPGGVLQTLTRRVGRQGLLQRNHGVLHIDHDGLAQHDLSGVRAATSRQYGSLLVAGSEYAKRQFDLEITPQEFGISLWAFIETNTTPLLTTVIDGRPLVSAESGRNAESDYVIAAFVVDASQNNNVNFEQLSTVVKGAVIASALYFPDPTDLDRRLDGLKVFLDTTILLRAIGACGPDMQRLATDILSLAVARGATMFCFDHSVRELRGVLGACEAAVKRRTGAYYGEATEYMVTAGWTYSDVVQLSSDLENHLNSMAITISETPPPVEQLTLDEERLEGLLQKEVHYLNEGARRKDLNSITAVYRLRNGREATSLARSRAIFVTPNTALVRASRTYSRIEDMDRGAIPLCLPDYVFTTSLWVTQALLAPELPIRNLIADCYSSLSVPDRVWRLYVEKIEELRTKGSVSVNEYVLLRQSLQVRALIMVDTKLDPESFTEGSVNRVLERARATIEGEVRAEAEAALSSAESAKQETRKIRAEAAAQNESHQRILAAERARTEGVVRTVSRTVTLACLSLIAVLVIVGAIFTLPSVAEKRPSGIVGFVILLAILLFTVSTLTSMFWEIGFRSASRSSQEWIATFILRWFYRPMSVSHEALPTADPVVGNERRPDTDAQ